MALHKSPGVAATKAAFTIARSERSLARTEAAMSDVLHLSGVGGTLLLSSPHPGIVHWAVQTRSSMRVPTASRQAQPRQPSAVVKTEHCALEAKLAEETLTFKKSSRHLCWSSSTPRRSHSPSTVQMATSLCLKSRLDQQSRDPSSEFEVVLLRGLAKDGHLFEHRVHAVVNDLGLEPRQRLPDKAPDAVRVRDALQHRVHILQPIGADDLDQEGLAREVAHLDLGRTEAIRGESSHGAISLQLEGEIVAQAASLVEALGHHALRAQRGDVARQDARIGLIELSIMPACPQKAEGGVLPMMSEHSCTKIEESVPVSRHLNAGIDPANTTQVSAAHVEELQRSSA
eukprot:CAMPEP_0177497162 /NCGR_PEP_ID=MMETSP0369-20130122/34890_1 /TAXON_ID=447022 ORGANISM="Scrippsiella hangoei-like, Strain SHHI-4" /NCGR_SAMPLE_ID=MMETSP0369 /ASSEMBLY_ACC=CAM_ASM_000364 /LENGTH=343 /DNA_ID=CAMNT_0018974275 /DNA_START=68 /DNA_END=1102 /DNA_ORIENTATION=-